MNRVAIFIDGPALYGCAKAMGIDIDYKALRSCLAGDGDLLRAYYYTVTAEDGEFEAVMPLLDWLEYNGFTVRTKAGKPFIDQGTGNRRVRGNCFIELAVEAMAIAPFFDTAFLVAGDADMTALVDGLQRLGKRVVVVSTIKTSPHQCADELRRQADHFLDLETVRAKIVRAVKPAREAVNA